MRSSHSLHRRLQALLLILMAIFFAQKLVSGTLYFYIGTRFGWLVLLAVILLIAIASSYNLVDQQQPAGTAKTDRYEGNRKAAWSMLLVTLPLILGVLVPAQPLGAGAVTNRGFAMAPGGSESAEQHTLAAIPGERNLLDWARIIHAQTDPTALNGVEAEVIGFVYRGSRLSADQIMVGRFVITCCVADAIAVGLVVQSPDVSGLPVDSWVRAQGHFSEGMLDGVPTIILMAESIQPIQQPEQPYLYP
nr:TIGR03943 family protein [Anaerolineae bacterium]